MNNLKHVNQIHLIQPFCIKFDPYYEILRPASFLYPEFSSWYHKTVLPGVNCGQREFIIERRDGRIAGIAIVKKTLEEVKLSTLRIADEFQGRGIGLKMFERCFEALDTDKPFLTVSEEKLPEFQRLFDYYGFELTGVIDGMYRQGKKEYLFNQK